jgi:GT2 family glycosyltransferase
VDRLAHALQGQRGVDDFEVVIVDNGSTDDTPAVLRRIAASWPAVRSIRLEQNRGPAPARNTGWRATGAPIVAFTDDDCVPQDGWLAALLSGFAAADIVQGRTVANPTQPRDGWFAWSPETLGPSGFYETCNIAYRRRLLEQLDGFDEGFYSGPRGAREPGKYTAPAWGDDTDLALRARAAGASAAFMDGAIVWHDIKPGGLVDRLRDLPRRSGVVAVVKRHPELRRSFDSPWFMDRAHAYVVVAAAGAVLIARQPRDPRRWVVAVALAWPWVRERGRYYPRKVWPRVLPQWLVVDLMDVGVMAAASARARTFFL